MNVITKFRAYRTAVSDTSNFIDFGTNSDGHYLNGRGDNPLILLTNSGEKMRITSTGKVGISNNSPAYPLDVGGDTRIGSGNYYLIHLGQSGVGSYRSAYIYGDGTNMEINNQQNGDLRLCTNNSEKVRITPSGNVGVGTSTPIAKLSVDYNGISAGQNVLSLHTSNTGTSDYNLIEAGHGTGTNFVLKGSGNIGIGTTSPNAPLQFSNDYGAGNKKIVLYEQTNNNHNFLGFGIQSAELRYQLNSPGDSHVFYAANHATAATSSTELMRIKGNGYVGIGTTNPGFPLHIASVASNYNGVYAGQGFSYIDATSYNFSAIADNTHPGTYEVRGDMAFYTPNSIRVDTLIFVRTLVSYSDKRIKTNIVDIDDEKALQILRLIKPKTYEYVDKLENGNANVIGFIAQEIKEIIPKAVTIIKKHIPNFMTLCQVSTTDVSNIMLVTSPVDLSWNPLHDQSGNAFLDASGNASSDASGNKFFNVKLYDQSNNEIICKTTDVLDKRSFLMDISGTTLLATNQYFLYGQEIDDFHTLDKQAIFTVVTAAVQDIDRKQQEDEAKIAVLESKNATLESKNATLESKNATLESTVSTLQEQLAAQQSQIATQQSLIAAQQSQIASQQAQIDAILAKIGGV